MTPEQREQLRALPSVTRLLQEDEVGHWLTEWSRPVVVSALQKSVDDARRTILRGPGEASTDLVDLLAAAEHELVRHALPRLRRVINATGIVLHTGLGRAPLCDAAIESIVDAAGGYCNLEMDLETGHRAGRTGHVEDRLTSLTGAESAIVVNNNAAATLMILRVLAGGREVIVSRGQLIEIGGSFRLPEIMEASGAVLREVGTTNRTRLEDYERAITDRTAALLHVHSSNYRVVGFTESVPVRDLVQLGHSRSLPVVDDLGSGALFDYSRFDLPPEPCARDSVAAGADLLCFSGDKLLGGPQCGIIVGRKELIGRIEGDPLMRTYRVDKLTLLALEATLRAYDESGIPPETIPALDMLTCGTDTLAVRARRLAERLESAVPGERFFVCSDCGYAGGGSMPERSLPTVVVQWRPAQSSTEAMGAALRAADPPVVARIRDDALCFDLRTIRESDIDPLVDAVSGCLWIQSEDSPPESTAYPSLPILESDPPRA